MSRKDPAKKTKKVFFFPTFLLSVVIFFIFTSLFLRARHFLFKPGGTSPMYCTTSPGYPLTSNTVYSPPPRPLPRNTFSRPAFSLKKPYKHCNWKCAALSAILISVTLLFLLAYFIGESPQVPPLRALASRFPTTRHGLTKRVFVLSLFLLMCLLCMQPLSNSKKKVTDVSPTHVFHRISPSVAHCALIVE